MEGCFSPRLGYERKELAPEESGHFARTRSLVAPRHVMGHPSRGGQQATELEDLEPRGEEWAGDVDLGDGKTQVCGFQVFLVLESQLETTETKPS